MEQLQGRVAVVTGAASGIGLALAERFAAEGMKIVMADIEAAALDSASAAVRAKAPAVHAVRIDVSRAEAELGWRPELSLEEGLRRTWDWIQAR